MILLKGNKLFGTLSENVFILYLSVDTEKRKRKHDRYKNSSDKRLHKLCFG